MEKTEKQYLYYIIDQYLKKQITSRQFCDEFYYCYGKELNYDTLTNMERRLFSELSKKASRFSEFEEDIENYPGTYFTEEQLNNQITEVHEILISL